MPSTITINAMPYIFHDLQELAPATWTFDAREALAPSSTPADIAPSPEEKENTNLTSDEEPTSCCPWN